jgi:zona occludens toxin (predicted ATPase)
VLISTGKRGRQVITNVRGRDGQVTTFREQTDKLSLTEEGGGRKVFSTVRKRGRKVIINIKGRGRQDITNPDTQNNFNL